jgi:hypothetical protein
MASDLEPPVRHRDGIPPSASSRASGFIILSGQFACDRYAAPTHDLGLLGHGRRGCGAGVDRGQRLEELAAPCLAVGDVDGPVAGGGDDPARGP